jgi:hypothetical protein
MPTFKRVHLALSRNIETTTHVAAALRGAGFEVRYADPNNRDDEAAVANDLDNIDAADALVLVLPTGRYGRVLASRGACAGKPTVVLAEGPGHTCQLGNTHFVPDINEMLSALAGAHLPDVPWWE